MAGYGDDQVIMRRALKRWGFTVSDEAKYSIEMEGTCSEWSSTMFNAIVYDEGRKVMVAELEDNEYCPDALIERLAKALAGHWSDDSEEHASEN